MGTANTMQCLAEALGLTLPGAATMIATSSELLRSAKLSGNQIVKLIEKNIRANDIMTLPALENMVTMMMVLGGSTNSVVHYCPCQRNLALEMW